ncbi:glutamate-rich WD repeat-containing protein 1, partial [Trichinella spiralis]
YPSKQ